MPVRPAASAGQTVEHHFAIKIIKNRVKEVMKADETLRKKVVRELLIATTGTESPTLRMLDSHNRTVPTKRAYIDVCMFRLIYSTPEIKHEIGRQLHHDDDDQNILGDVPPFLPSLLNPLFNKPRYQGYQIETKVATVRLSIMLFLVMALWISASIFARAWLYGAVVGSTVVYCLIGRQVSQHLHRERALFSKRSSSCCVCGLSTNDLQASRRAMSNGDQGEEDGSTSSSDSMNDDTQDGILMVNLKGDKKQGRHVPIIRRTEEGEAGCCPNCNGTAVCKIGCKTCCPFFIPVKDVERRVDMDLAMASKPELKSRFRRKLENRLLEHINGGNRLTKTAKNGIIMKVLSENPGLEKEIEDAVREYKEQVRSGERERGCLPLTLDAYPVTVATAIETTLASDNDSNNSQEGSGDEPTVVEAVCLGIL